MAGWLKSVLLVASLLAPFTSAYSIKPSSLRFQAGNPSGISIAYRKDDPGMSLVAFHFNGPNKPAVGVQGTDFGADVTSVSSDGYFVHNVPGYQQLRPGDRVHYWLYVLVNGVGYQLTDQVWTYGADAATVAQTTPRTKPTSAATKPPATKPPGSPAPTSGSSANEGSGGSGASCDCGNVKPTCTSFPCLIFEDNFDSFDLGRWEHEITAGGGGNWEFQYYLNNRSNSYVKNGKLHLKPTLASDKWGEDWPMTGSIDMWGSQPADTCTGNQWWGCSRQAQGGNIVNPIQSARVRTVKSFNFRYGKLEVEAKLPRGDWIWPAIWLLPRYQSYGMWPASGEIDLMESRGNSELYDAKGVNIGTNQVASTLHFGPYFGENGWATAHGAKNLPAGKTFADGFHKFAVDWNKDGMKFSVDDEVYLHIETGDGYWNRAGWNQKLSEESNPWAGRGPEAPFDQEFYLVMNVAVGGTGGYFADGLLSRPHPKAWSNTSPTASRQFWDNRNQWMPTWPNDDNRAMQINYVRVWKMNPEDV